MSTVYVVKYEDEDGTHVDWGVDKDSSGSVEVIGIEFYYINDGGSEAEIYNWVQDCLGELDRIGHEPTRERSAQWICAQVDYMVDEHEFTDEASLRSWQPDKYRLARSEYTDAYLLTKWSLNPQNHQPMTTIIFQIQRLMDAAKVAAALEQEDGEAYERFMKEVANA